MLIKEKVTIPAKLLCGAEPACIYGKYVIVDITKDTSDEFAISSNSLIGAIVNVGLSIEELIVYEAKDSLMHCELSAGPNKFWKDLHIFANDSIVCDIMEQVAKNRGHTFY